MLKSNLLRCIKKKFATCYSRNVLDMMEMFPIFSFRNCPTLVKSGRTKRKFLKNPKKLVKNLSACLKHGMKSKLRPVITPDKKRRHMTLSLWSGTLYVICRLETNFISQFPHLSYNFIPCQEFRKQETTNFFRVKLGQWIISGIEKLQFTNAQIMHI